MDRNQHPHRRKRIFNNIVTTFKVLSRIKKRAMSILLANVHFLNWRGRDVLFVSYYHPLLCIFTACVFFFFCLEYTSRMIPASSPPLDLRFMPTKHFNHMLASRPIINTFLACLNTIFVVMQALYILWTWLIEGRPRLLIATLFMITIRGILGYSTKLPLPEDFIGSGMDFPVGNMSFFTFFSGHVAASVMVSRDMRRMERHKVALVSDYLNLLQMMRLLSTRGRYTINLIVGIGAGILSDFLAEKYEQSRMRESLAIGIKSMIYGGSCSCRVCVQRLSLLVVKGLKKIMCLELMAVEAIIRLELMVVKAVIRLGLMVPEAIIRLGIWCCLRFLRYPRCSTQYTLKYLK